MIVAGHRRPEEDNALDVRSCGLTGAFHKFVDGICRNHCILTSRKSKLPTAACTTPAKAAETASATESTAPTPKASASAPPTEYVRKKDPEQDATQRRGENDQEDDDQENDPAKRKA